MSEAICAHCKTPITDRSTVIEADGELFCCKNCGDMAGVRQRPEGASPAERSGAQCAHCQIPIVDAATMVTRGDQTFCCNNCANALAAGAASTGVSGTARDH